MFGSEAIISWNSSATKRLFVSLTGHRSSRELLKEPATLRVEHVVLFSPDLYPSATLCLVVVESNFIIISIIRCYDLEPPFRSGRRMTFPSPPYVFQDDKVLPRRTSQGLRSLSLHLLMCQRINSSSQCY